MPVPKQPNPIETDHADPDCIAAMAKTFIGTLEVKRFSYNTIKKYIISLSKFIKWCNSKGLSSPIDVTRDHIEKYQRHLFNQRKANGERISARTQFARLSCLRTYFSYLSKKRHIIYNPTADLDMPQIGDPLPQFVLTAKETEAILSQPDLDDPLGIRDRAILETLYSTGMRRAELVSLKIFHIDKERGTVNIREGKGKRDRVVPIGERALKWIEKYLEDVRPGLLKDPRDDRLFINVRGDLLTADGLTQRVSRYVQNAAIGKKGSCHLFRHTMATLMLENGADIRYVQEMLGHVDLETTQIYTRVSIVKLKEIHAKTHPAKMKATAKEKPAKG